jgi:hypothetical protein
MSDDTPESGVAANGVCGSIRQAARRNAAVINRRFFIRSLEKFI